MWPQELKFLLTRSLLPSYRPTPSFHPRFLSSSAPSPSSKPLLILGLESSADDSCVSIVTSDRRILSNIVLKQTDLLEKWAHQRNIPRAIQQALKEAGVGLGDLDGIAFTRGPGMYGCLSQCAGAAKALAAATGLPLMGVHHMQAHALTPFLTEKTPPTFPFLTLLLSGGHTLLLLARSETDFKILATTQDESIGASLDKASRALEIPLSLGHGSAGAALEAFAFGSSITTTTTTSPDSSTLPSPPSFPLPFRHQLSFSYSGARSSLTRLLTAEPPNEMTEERKKQVSGAFMKAAFEQVGEKVGLAVRGFEKEVKEVGGEERLGGLVVSGGVASNLYLRRSLRAKLDSLGYPTMPLIFPPPHLCTDNAAMIAQVGHSRLRRGRIDPLTVGLKAKWSIEECERDFEEGGEVERE
ncbi:glycoprotease family-domain-containing protein [Leucosporidium creatinivorum]|uniref:N(6)-L-threonylcarbamoyladenine synthase n=1 Tax=Leucosporidium creatinivorum TaxID=106004 RepID=A0A1Y2ELT3_9BASI|nr:glycoprotease family-domain-containing protein [Leucosporidium creatinivorum]